MAGRIDTGLVVSGRGRRATSSDHTPLALTTTLARTSVPSARRAPVTRPAVVRGVRRPGRSWPATAPYGGRGAGHGQRQPGVVGLRVPVEEGGHQPVRAQVREVGQGLGGVDALVPLADAHPAGQVVEPQRRRVGLGDALDTTPSRPNSGIRKGRGWTRWGALRQQPLAFVEGLVDQAVLALLQIAQPAVDQLRRLRRGARREVPGLDQRGSQAPGRASSATPQPVIPPPMTSTSKLLGRQPLQRLVAIEGDGCRHGPSRYRPPLACTGQSDARFLPDPETNNYC